MAQWQAKAKERRDAGVFLVEGFKMCEEAPEDGIREVYLSEDALEKALAQPAIKRRLEGSGYEVVRPEVFRKMSDTQTPQGILCVMARPEYKLEQLLEAPSPLFVVLENLQDPGNLGTMIRAGEGAGATGIILGGQTVDLYHPKTIRATMGSIYRVPVVCAEDLREVMRMLRQNGIRTYAAHLEGERYYDSFSFREGTAFLIGNESNGLSRELAAMADERLKIPMEGRLESLNAAVTAALLVYEAHRQRRNN